MKKPFRPATRTRLSLFPLALLLSCASTPAGNPPLWVTNPEDAYPGRDWLCVVETAAGRNTAEDAALTALARTFRLDVQAITRTHQELLNTVQRKGGKETSGTTEMRRLENELTAVSEVSGLIGVQRDVWAGGKNGVVYASARMNRAEGAARYTALIQEHETLINMLTASAENAGGTFDAYGDLAFAARIAELTDTFYTILGVLQPDAAGRRPAYGNAETIRARMREQAALIVIQVDVSGDVDSRIAKAFASVFSKRGFKTSAALTEKSYTVQADFQTEDAAFTDSQYQYVRFVLTASLMDKDGNAVVSFSENGRSGHLTQGEAVQKAIRDAEAVITGSGFAKEFDAYLGSL
jgi:hypothetical protein